MIVQPGHVALIVPHFATDFRMWDVGVYEYLGSHRWREHSAAGAGRFLYTGVWA